MLLLLIGALLLASVLVLCLKKSQESFCLLGMCLSLLLQFCGILIFIAKKGGFSQEVLTFLYFSMEIKNKVQYMLITLNAMGYLIALGRYLFPLFLIEFSLCYSMMPVVRRNSWLKKAVVIPPVLSLVIYLPHVFRILSGSAPWAQDVIVQCSYGWVLAYVVAALLLLIVEFFSITIRFYRRQFSLIVICIVALSGLYLLYCGQDPGQVYRFYSYGYLWNKGIGYMQYAPTVGGYYTIVIVNVICGILGFSSLMRYTQGSFESNREDIVMERKFAAARDSASVFVHGMKNQLLANRVLFKRIRGDMEQQTVDMRQLHEHVDGLQASNELLISRVEELYSTVKTQSIRMVPTSLSAIADDVLERFHSKYADGKVETMVAGDDMLMVDEAYFNEALCNLLVNGWEATLAVGRDDPLIFRSHNERMYTVIEISDKGVGVRREDHKRIFEPFYSSKNSNHNWGMGLYYVRSIVKGHVGTLRLESKVGEGSSFYVILPKCGKGE